VRGGGEEGAEGQEEERSAHDERRTLSIAAGLRGAVHLLVTENHLGGGVSNQYSVISIQ
jgi:hypothetical protein